ncbi:MAG: flavin oxidoreductase [Spirochaetaceae bacterium]|nr:flavin oxidoreductase [Spirochaetaceae bacterium]|tara:strand:+ start:29953 stop:30570 length:618 start_codon:yes stop_codon:yes gene_type:complete
MEKLRLKESELARLGKVPRLNLVNSLSGYKSANLIATANSQGVPNLAIFSSVIHLGSDPALLGFMLRPTTVARHTYENIKETRHYTINHIHEDMIEPAHQTSGKYPAGQSEFEATGLTPETWEGQLAPFVAESRIQVGLRFEEEHMLKVNRTRLIVGRILEIRFPQEIQQSDGTLDLEKAKVVTISGADTYSLPATIRRMPYVRL